MGGSGTATARPRLPPPPRGGRDDPQGEARERPRAPAGTFPAPRPPCPGAEPPGAVGAIVAAAAPSCPPPSPLRLRAPTDLPGSPASRERWRPMGARSRPAGLTKAGRGGRGRRPGSSHTWAAGGGNGGGGGSQGRLPVRISVPTLRLIARHPQRGPLPRGAGGGTPAAMLRPPRRRRR